MLSACAAKVVAHASRAGSAYLAHTPGGDVEKAYIPLLMSTHQLRSIIEVSHHSAEKIHLGMGYNRDEVERSKMILFPGLTKAFKSKEEAEKRFSEAAEDSFKVLLIVDQTKEHDEGNAVDC